MPTPGECSQLVALFSAGRHIELENQARLLIEQYPESGFLWKVLGASLGVQGKNALPATKKATDLLPNDAEAHNNFGNALRDLGQLDDAVASYRRALEVKPDYADAHSNLGTALKDLGQLDEAVASYRRALEVKPDFANTHVNLGIVLKDLGQFGSSLSSICQAVTLTVQNYRNLAAAERAKSFDRQRPKTPMLVPEAREVLNILKVRLDAAVIPWCLFAGTLLGVIRDGDLLPYDKDVDIALPCTVDRKRLIQLLTTDGEFRLTTRFSWGLHDSHIYDMCFIHARHNIGVDLFFLHPDGQDHFLVGPDHPGQPILSRIDRFGLGLRDWRGGLWPVPVEYEGYFCNVYGDGWQQPDPYYDTVISSPSRIAESIPVVLCYGYAKLYSHLQDRNWQATKAYCTQLQKRVVDPLLDEVGRWAEQQLALTETAC
jgi:tetratricopeptide (TPR) repeat protein